jgi:hypothetical protein
MWLAGEKPIMMATTTCLAGIDNPNCNVVIFVDFFPWMIPIAQGAGRGGRKGQETLVLFVTSDGHRYSTENTPEDDPQCGAQGVEMLTCTDRCHRWQFGLTFNGEGQTCAQVADAMRCQRCEPGHPLFRKLHELGQIRVSAQAQRQPLMSPFRFAAPSRQEPRSAQNCYAPYSNPSDIPPASSARAAPGHHVVRGAMADNLISKLQALADLSMRLKGHCAACWALHGRFNIANHLPFLTCSTGRSLPTDVNSPGYDGPGFKAKFEDYTACWGCWLPQLNGTVNKHLYTRTNHPVPGKGRCTHPFAFKEIAWVVFKTPDLWAKFLNSSNFPVPPHVTVEKYATWLTRQDKGMVNVGNVAYWLLRHYGLST